VRDYLAKAEILVYSASVSAANSTESPALQTK
jgi:hypothetical protein